MIFSLTDDGRFALKKALRWFFLAWGSLLVHRLIFLTVYFPGVAEAPLGALFTQYFFGLRFDLASLPLLAGPFLLFAPAYTHYRQGSRPVRSFLRFINFGQYVWFIYVSMTLIASTFNFNFNNKHIGWEYYAYFQDISTIFSGLIEERPVQFLLYLLTLPLFVWAGYFMVYRLKNNDYVRIDRSGQTGAEPGIKQYLITAGSMLLIAGLFVLALRGGFQENPLRSADAMYATGGSSYLNSVPLNGVFTIVQDRHDVAEFRKFYDQDENIKYVQKLLGKPEDFFSDEYPLLRKMPPRALPGARTGGGKPNIVFILLESFTAKFLKEHGGDPEIAPNLNTLIEGGRYYRRFYASGGRSANGLFATLAGLPDRAGRTILRSAQIQNRFGGVAGLLSRKNYRTFFIHGGNLKFDNLNRVLPHLGFEKSIGMRDMDKTGRYKKKTAWGYHDEESFDVLYREMLGGDTNRHDRRPFFGVLFTVNTHHPYPLPDKKLEFFPPEKPGGKFLNAYRYTDQCLGEFFKRARQSSSFNNTIFVIMADHTNHAGLNYLEDRHIPMLIYAPGRVRPVKLDVIGSQLDMLPTLLALSGGDSHYAAMGRDLTLAKQPENPFAFFAGGSNTNVIGWIQKDRLLSRWLENKNQYLFTSTPPGSLHNLAGVEKDIADDYTRKVQAFHQFARFLERENKIWPPPGSSLLGPTPSP